MAKGKKSSGKHYVSKGERPNVKRSTLNAVRLDRDPVQNALYKQDSEGKKKK
jgi:hypothetical protein